MKTINLRTYYYPHYTEDVFVEVGDEVAEVMLLSMLDEALSQITPVQARRVRSYYLRDLNFPGIAQEEGVNKDVVCRSVHTGLKRLQEYYSRRNQTE